MLDIESDSPASSKIKS